MPRVLLIHGAPNKELPYVEALRRAGVEPVDGHSPKGYAGLVLMGGADVNPRLYGEEPRPEVDDDVDDERDGVELAAIREALELDLPILAICRGMQILNVSQGGSLIQHVDTVDRHRQKRTHTIDIVPGSLLAGIAGERQWEVNSRHHQAVKSVGAGLRVSASDGEMVEAIELPDRRFVLGVQWHPEDMNGVQRKLFESFASALA